MCFSNHLRGGQLLGNMESNSYVETSGLHLCAWCSCVLIACHHWDTWLHIASLWQCSHNAHATSKRQCQFQLETTYYFIPLGIGLGSVDSEIPKIHGISLLTTNHLCCSEGEYCPVQIFHVVLNGNISAKYKPSMLFGMVPNMYSQCLTAGLIWRKKLANWKRTWWFLGRTVWETKYHSWIISTDASVLPPTNM